MIPKQIFFVWLGDNKPNYVDFTVKTFKEVNPDFKIDLILEPNIYNTKNKILQKCVNIIVNNDFNNCYGKMLTADTPANRRRKGNIQQNVANIFRMELLYNYGGIYLDCDTFPVEPFDNKLLCNDSFCCESQFVNIKKRTIPDIFFLGCCKGNIAFSDVDSDGHVTNKTRIKTINVLDFYTDRFKLLKKKFFDCKLKYGEKIYDNSLYIDHYIHKTWYK